MKYWRNSGGENCPLDNVVVTVDKCREAASQLGLTYKKGVLSVKKPAGCYQNGGDVYFNRKTDPSKTDPSKNLHLNGVCGS
jgi:hypothetical protein